MKKLNLFFIGIMIFLSSPAYGSQRGSLINSKAVTYELGGGRFGDKMLCYLHAKWISYKYKIPLLYKPFAYSNELVMHYKESRFTQVNLSKYNQVISPGYQHSIKFNDYNSTLFVIPYFPECLWEHIPEAGYYYIAVDWDDPQFRKEIKKMIEPLKGFKPFLQLPKDRITVAVHVRRGGSYDDPETAKKIPLKLPPDSYYLEQIQRMYEIYNGAPLYVYIFTDEKNPLAIVEHYRSYFEGMNIDFDCRVTGNNHRSNVLNDFFEMTRFDCLIRPDSNYSIVASKIADYKVIISPSHAVKNNGSIYVDEVSIKYSGY